MELKPDIREEVRQLDHIIRNVDGVYPYWVILEYRLGKRYCAHIVSVPQGKRAQTFVQHQSLSWYQRREWARMAAHYDKLRAGLNPPPLEKDFHIRPYVDYVSTPYKGLYVGLPIHNHASVWDFYKAIGYNKKKKRYV